LPKDRGRLSAGFTLFAQGAACVRVFVKLFMEIKALWSKVF